jgi:hypothetical protein
MPIQVVAQRKFETSKILQLGFSALHSFFIARPFSGSILSQRFTQTFKIP